MDSKKQLTLYSPDLNIEQVEALLKNEVMELFNNLSTRSSDMDVCSFLPLASKLASLSLDTSPEIFISKASSIILEFRDSEDKHGCQGAAGTLLRRFREALTQRH